MTRVFVYEHLSGGGTIDGDAAAVGALLPQGLAMRDALVGDLLRVDGCSVSAAVSERAPAAPDGAARVMHVAGESAFDYVAAQSAAHELTLVIAPETGGLLTQFCRRVEASRWLGCSIGAIRLASSKRATLLRLAGRGLLTPLAFCGPQSARSSADSSPPASALQAAQGRPQAPAVPPPRPAGVGSSRKATSIQDRTANPVRWVVKPDDGAGAVATRVHEDRSAAWDDWSLRSRAGHNAAVEPWVEGEALSLSLLCGGRGGGQAAENVELLSINRQQIAVNVDGTLSFAGIQTNAVGLESPHGAALAAVALQAVRAIPGLHGFVGIDLVWHAERGPVLIEINPRVTSAYVGLSAALGRNLAADMLRHAHREAINVIA